jgi:hypothetical protein
MLRITRVEDTDGRTCLRLEGRVVGPWVAELAADCAAAARAGGLTLDMAGVSFLDGTGCASSAL